MQMNRRALVLDEDPRVIEQIRTVLGREGFEVLATGDAREGLCLARRERPDLLLVSAQIDPIDGFHFCRLLKRHHSTELLPILLTSRRDHRRGRARSRLVGAVAYLEKPLDENLLVDRVYENLILEEESTLTGGECDFILREFGF